MPTIEEVRWARGSMTPDKEDEPGMDYIETIYGEWKAYSCRITPMHQHHQLYQAMVGGYPSKHCPTTKTSNMGAEEAIDWCLQNMERLQETEEKRIGQARIVKEQGEENSLDAALHLSKLAGIPERTYHTPWRRC